MLNLKKILILIVLLFNNTQLVQANELIDNANESLDYLVTSVVDSRLDEYSLEDAVAAINSISVALNHAELTKDSEIYVRRIRALAAHSINAKRSYENKSRDISLSMRAISDINYVLKEKSGDNSNLIYAAGLIAFNHIKDSVLAYEYWSECAELRHAGCMNIMASESFTGLNGSLIDIDRSILWHQRVFETGIQYSCAGLLSANILSEIAFFFPKLKTGGDWHFWRERRDELFVELESKPDFNSEELCQKGTLFFQDYMIDTVTGIPDKTKLNLAKRASKEKDVINFLDSILRGDNPLDSLNFIREMTNNYQQCDLAFVLLYLARHQENEIVATKIEDYLFTLERAACSTQFATIQRFRDQGRW